MCHPLRPVGCAYEVAAAHVGNDSRTLERTIVVHVSRVTAGDRCGDEWPKALVTLTNLALGCVVSAGLHSARRV
jgi:hypothetical protein